MAVRERPDDFEVRRQALAGLSDQALHARFWELVECLVTPLVDEAREHTTPAIERSVLLRMGFTSSEAQQIAKAFHARGWLGHGAGHLLVLHAERRGVDVRAAGLALLEDGDWESLRP